MNLFNKHFSCSYSYIVKRFPLCWTNVSSSVAPLCNWISHSILLKCCLVVQHNIHELSGVIKFNISPDSYHMRKGQLKQLGKWIFGLNNFPQTNIWCILITGKFATKINLKTKFWVSACSLSTVIPSPLPANTNHGLYFVIYHTNK